MKALLIDASQGMQIKTFSEFLPEINICYKAQQAFDVSCDHLQEVGHNQKTYQYTGRQINGVYIYSEEGTAVSPSFLKKKVISFIALHTSFVYVRTIEDTGPSYRLGCVLGHERCDIEIPKILFSRTTEEEMEEFMRRKLAEFAYTVVSKSTEQLASAIVSDLQNKLH